MDPEPPLPSTTPAFPSPPCDNPQQVTSPTQDHEQSRSSLPNTPSKESFGKSMDIDNPLLVPTLVLNITSVNTDLKQMDEELESINL